MLKRCLKTQTLGIHSIKLLQESSVWPWCCCVRLVPCVKTTLSFTDALQFLKTSLKNWPRSCYLVLLFMTKGSWETGSVFLALFFTKLWDDNQGGEPLQCNMQQELILAFVDWQRWLHAASMGLLYKAVYVIWCCYNIPFETKFCLRLQKVLEANL